MLKAYTFRLYPTASQEARLNQWFGTYRFVYNRLLDKRSKAYKRRKENMTFINGLNAFLHKLKALYPWINDTYSQCLQMAGRNLDTAFENFFRDSKHFRYPNFKKRAYKQSLQFPQGVKVSYKSESMRFPKLGDIKCIYHRRFKGTVKTVTIERTSSMKYFARVLVDTQDKPQILLDVKNIGLEDVLGIDMGLKSLATCSDGTVIENTRERKRLEKSLAKAQRVLSRRKGARKGEQKSSNYLKQRIKVARLQEKIANTRKDNIEKATSLIAGKSHAVICMENLNIKDMQRSRLSYSVSDAGMSYFMSRLKQKCMEKGKHFIKVNRFYPSSRICSSCGYLYKDLTLKIRNWQCPVCHTLQERDFNASRNLQSEGYRLIKLPMDGGEITPVEMLSVDDRKALALPKKHDIVETGRVLSVF